MFCKKCGNELANEQRFCSRCGTPATMRCRVCGAENIAGAPSCVGCGNRFDAPTTPAEPPRVPRPRSQPAPQPAAPQPPVTKPSKQPRPAAPKPPWAPKPAVSPVGLVSGRFRSVWLLLCILFLSASLVLSLYSAATAADELWDGVASYVRQIDREMADQIDGLIRQYDTGSLAMAILGKLPAVLLLVSLCICCASALIRPQEDIPTAALSIVRVLALVMGALYALSGVLMLFGSLVVVLVSKVKLTNELALLLGAGLLITTAVIALAVVYCLKASRTALCLREYVRHDFSQVLPSFVPIMSYIVCGVKVVFAVAAILLGGVMTALPALLSAAYLFCLGIFLSSFKRAVSRLA